MPPVNKGATAGPKKHAGIRSLLGADSSNTSEGSKHSPADMSIPTTSNTATTGITIMDVLKNNIEVAIRNETESNPPVTAQSTPCMYTNQPQHHSKQGMASTVLCVYICRVSTGTRSY